MPLDNSTLPKNVTGTLHYLQRTAERPVRYVGAPPTGRCRMERYRRSARRSDTRCSRT